MQAWKDTPVLPRSRTAPAVLRVRPPNRFGVGDRSDPCRLEGSFRRRELVQRSFPFGPGRLHPHTAHNGQLSNLDTTLDIGGLNPLGKTLVAGKVRDQVGHGV